MCQRKLKSIKKKELLSLIDGAYEIVELFIAKTPAQFEWKREWLKKAREVGAVSEV